jgi:hypothetical protein
MGLERFGEWSGPYVDAQAAGTDSWLKGLVVHRAADGTQLETLLVTSPDGIRWHLRDGARWHPLGADPIASLSAKMGGDTGGP